MRPEPAVGKGLIPACLAAIGGAGVIVLADAAREHNGASLMDPRIAHDAIGLRSGLLTALAHTLTFIGSELVVGAAAAVVMLLLLRRRMLLEAVVIGVGIVGAAAFTLGLKYAVARARPPALDRLGPIDHSHSFPSGHTLTSAVLLGLILIVLVPRLTHSRRTIAVVAAVVLELGIGLSRVYLGYHWATDVIASWMLAIAWVSVVALGLSLFRHSRLWQQWQLRWPTRSE